MIFYSRIYIEFIDPACIINKLLKEQKEEDGAEAGKGVGGGGGQGKNRVKKPKNQKLNKLKKNMPPSQGKRFISFTVFRIYSLPGSLQSTWFKSPWGKRHINGHCNFRTGRGASSVKNS